MGTLHALHELRQNSGTNPPEPPDMEARIAKLEAWGQHTDTTLSDIKQDMRDFRQEVKRDMSDFRQEMKDMRKDMRDDFRILFSAIIAVALGLSAIMAKGFGWL